MRFLLLPFSWIYAFVIACRNGLYNYEVYKTHHVKKSIGIGNLSMGGTGKTPLTVYLTHWLIEHKKNVFILSRGYKRTTTGEIEVKLQHESHEVGDEPLMYKKRFKENVRVLVSKNRWTGSQKARTQDSEAILLFDDIFQHRVVKVDFSIVTTPYNDLFVDDFILPVGRLREPKTNIKRANCILITRCPDGMTSNKKQEIENKLSSFKKPVFFSSIKYDKFTSIGTEIEAIQKILLVTGIADNKALRTYLERSYELEVLSYPDHYQYTQKDMEEIHQKFGNFANNKSIILTTEKDGVRMLKFDQFIKDHKWPLYVQPISIEVQDEKEFKSLIKNYVGEV